MDYKNQSGNQPDPGQAFFTPGAGEVSSPDDDLDLTSASWPAPESVKPIKEALNHQEITPPGDILNTPIPDTEMKNGLGEAIDDVLPPAAMQNLPPSPTPEVLQTAVFNEKLIYTKGDRINQGALSEINNAIDNLGRTGDTAGFYTTVRGDENNLGMLGKNLKYSYDRIIGKLK